RFSIQVKKPGRREADPSNLVVGIRASAVNFGSEAASDAADFASAEAGEKPGKGRRRAGPIAADNLTVTVGKAKVKLVAKVRVDELNKARDAAGLHRDSENRFEPAPWAAWRASRHYAPLKPAKGVHLRYLLGDGEGLAILASGRWPLAWQVLSWEEESKSETLIQAFHLLRLHATRRLQFPGIDYVSVQGNNHLPSGWEQVAEAVGRPVQHVDGPAYGPELISFGLALGALAPKEETIDLASSLREDPPLLKLVPWGEVGLGLAMFFCMFLVMSNHASNLRKDLHDTTARIEAVGWAKGLQIAKLKSEAAALDREVTPLEKFIARDISFSHAFASVADVLPDKTWLVVAEGKDLMWEKNPNKALGEHYLLLDTGVPNTSGDTTPPEINQTVRRLEHDDFLKDVLPRAKLMDVTWRQEGGSGYTVFTVLLKPKK
ncbi:MAG: hypothetical protein D6760_03040, partial [Deltaproteobacteria bacterium]